MGHGSHMTWPDQQRRSDVPVLKAPEQFAALVVASFGHDLDAAVVEVLGEADQAQLKRVSPDPPAESDTLNTPADPRGQPDVRGHVTTGHCEVVAGS